MQPKIIKIGDRKIGKGHPTFIIAEVGSNHRGKIKNALRAIELAAKTGADAVKFQHLTASKIAADTPFPIKLGKKKFKSYRDLYKSAEMPYSWTSTLMRHAKKNKIIFLSTPFDKDAVDVLDLHNVPAFKVASYEITDDILLSYIAKKKRPVILSTGMATLDEIKHAIRVIKREGNNKIIVLHCISIYPPKFEDLNLRAIQTLEKSLKLPIGYSDHSLPPFVTAPLVAVSLGACVIERHFTQNRGSGSNDDPNSLEPSEFANMVREIRYAEAALSRSGVKKPISHKIHKLGHDEVADLKARRSLYAACNIPKGVKFTENMLITLRPTISGAIKPRDYKKVIGKKARRTIETDSPIIWKDLSD